jgi:hypothetical protein
MRLAKAYGDHGPEYVDTWEPIMGFTTQAEADAYVYKIYDACTAAEKFRVRLAFLGDLTQDAYDEFESGERYDPENKNEPEPFRGFSRDVPGTAFGGGVPPEKEYLLHNLMEYADSIHDCSVPRPTSSAIKAPAADESSWKVPHRRQYIRRCVGSPVLPVVVDRIRLTPRQRAGMTTDTLLRLQAKRRKMKDGEVASWDAFLKFMTTNATLDFGGGNVVPNRMNGRNFIAGMFEYKSGDFELLYKEYLMHCIKGHVYEETPEYVVDDGNLPKLVVGGSVYADILRSLLSTAGHAMSDIDAAFESVAKLLEPEKDAVQGYCAHVEVWADQNMATRKEIIKLTQLADLCRNMRKVYGTQAKFMLDTDPLIVQMIFGIELTYAAFAKLFELDPADATTLLPKVKPEVREAYTEQKLFEAAYKAFKEAVGVKWTLWTCDACNIDSRRTKLEPVMKFSDKDTGDVFHERSNVQVTLTESKRASFTYTVRSNMPGVYIDDAPREAINVHGTWYVDGEPVRYSANSVIDKIDAMIFRPGNRVVDDPDLRAAELLALKRAGDWGMIRHCKDNGIVFVTQDRFCALYAALMDVETMFVRVAEHDGVNQYSFALMTRETPRTHAGGSSPSKSPVLTVGLIALTVMMAIIGSVTM